MHELLSKGVGNQSLSLQSLFHAYNSNKTPPLILLINSSFFFLFYFNFPIIGMVRSKTKFPKDSVNKQKKYNCTYQAKESILRSKAYVKQVCMYSYQSIFFWSRTFMDYISQFFLSSPWCSHHHDLLIMKRLIQKQKSSKIC